jgi:tetratricopeptide (TPR) repeat protein
MSPEAYDLLLKGYSYRAKGTSEDRKKAGEYFRQASEADPRSGIAFAELSDIYRSLIGSNLLDPVEYLPKARAAAEKALELDKGLAEGHYALANLMTYAWEWGDAEREYRSAIDKNPNLALAHRWYASYLRLVGRHDQAIEEIKRASELDPVSPGVNATVGFILFNARRYDAAVESLNQTLKQDENYPYTHLFLGFVHAAKQRYAEAIGEYQKAMRLGLDTPATRVYLAAAYAQSGERGRAQEMLSRLQAGKDFVSDGQLAILYAALGERERAFASLDKAFAAHDVQLQSLGVEPGFDTLRDDPRFKDLMRRVGL